MVSDHDSHAACSDCGGGSFILAKLERQGLDPGRPAIEAWPVYALGVIEQAIA